MKYLVIELQTYDNGSVANIVTDYNERPQAESKFHTVLAAAAVSGLPCHAAVLITNEGYIIDQTCYSQEEEEELMP